MDSVRPGIGQTGFVRPDSVRSAVATSTGLTATDIEALDSLTVLLRESPAAFLTGAGLSTDSGIPDYRGPDAPVRKPVTYQEFVGDTLLRQRYWARNHVGWTHMHHAVPNLGHYAAAALERGGYSSGIITQNVDGLHEDAGATNVVDLHGRFDQVVCMGCNNTYSRTFLAGILTELNPGFLDAVVAAGGVSAAPDADADLEGEKLISEFQVARCPLCGGMLKPDFVFFGENVPKERVLRSFGMVDSAELLIVAGSSLTVMSGLRFVKKAAKDGKHVVIINRGITRGDPLADVKLDIGVGEALGYLADELGLDWRNH
ncbi:MULTISPECIES: Sir2 family NAD-dependent protein deacetylase [Arthrobacter]|uniref:Sir2 family NAD-dependent protein deacetylase n=1 Tax=unclassified Arthrobacter TaxID=235627 RepID=UPI0024B97FFC|nr:Sir2 family NAD-dependent protein deacetylase [Arthrobacter sp. H35-MC1]MDJ0316146.1 Sir2 family NAD-dependent protein deacetylase [Arthrobacter sp. H35-MC1]